MKKKKQLMRVGSIVCDETHTYQCKHCGTPAYFVEKVLGVEYYSCPECGGFTPRKI